MKITLIELKQIIRSVVSECYGWPVESKKPLYGINKEHLGKPGPHDGKNSPLKFPRGKNSKKMNESFSKITARELSEWQSGNWGFMHEDASNECSECGRPLPVEGAKLPEGMHECSCG